MTYIVVVGAFIIGSMVLYNMIKPSNSTSEDQTEIVESVNTNQNPNIMTQDTFKSDYAYAITGQGKINGVIFSMAGIKKKDVQGQLVDHIIIDVDDFIYAKEGDIVTLRDKLTIQILKITNPPHPAIGKVYFDVLN